MVIYECELGSSLKFIWLIVMLHCNPKCMDMLLEISSCYMCKKNEACIVFEKII